MIEGYLYLRRPHPLVRRNQSFRQELALGIVDEQCDVPIAIVLGYVLSERIQCLRHVCDGRKHC